MNSFVLIAFAAFIAVSNQQCPRLCQCGSGLPLATTMVDCSNGNATNVPEGNATDAEALVLDHNKIGHLDLAFLQRYPELKMLSVRYNALKSLSKSGNDFQPFFNLVHLDASQNNLHVIHSYVFVGFPSLKTLNLSANVIHTISETAFALPELQTIDLSHNR